MEAQGKEEELDRLVQMIQGSPYIDVADLTVKETGEIEGERSFRIR